MRPKRPLPRSASDAAATEKSSEAHEARAKQDDSGRLRDGACVRVERHVSNHQTVSLIVARDMESKLIDGAAESAADCLGPGELEIRCVPATARAAVSAAVETEVAAGDLVVDRALE